MPTAIEPELVTFKTWIFRLRQPEGKASRILLLLHGWKGDENSMWVFAHNLSPEYVILGPRGPFQEPDGGYSWRDIKAGKWGKASLEDLQPSAEKLYRFVEDWSASAGLDASQFDLMGFSQGAAMAYSLALLHPERIRKLAILSGFIPEGGEALIGMKKLAGKAVFMTHGRQDELIRVERARSAQALLKESGAQVTYCESDTAHKVSRECLIEMERYFAAF